MSTPYPACCVVSRGQIYVIRLAWQALFTNRIILLVQWTSFLTATLGFLSCVSLVNSKKQFKSLCLEARFFFSTGSGSTHVSYLFCSMTHVNTARNQMKAIAYRHLLTREIEISLLPFLCGSSRNVPYSALTATGLETGT